MSRPRPAWTPPTVDGVSPSRVAVTAGPRATLAEFLDQRLPPGGPWAPRLARGEVLDALGQPLAADARCQPGAVLWYWRSLPPEPRVPFELAVLHQDEHLLVVDKPHFLPAIPGGRYLQETAMVRLKRQLGLDTLSPIHRLDRETAGVLAFSVCPATRDAYHALMRERRVHKVYEAVAPWRDGLALPLQLHHRLEEPLGEGFMQMQVVPGAPNAHTEVQLIARLPASAAGPVDAAAVPDPATPLAHYRLLPITGRRHQLRAQLNAIGLPIVGDRIYPRLWPMPPLDAVPDYREPLQLLARELAFTDPVSGRPMRLVSGRVLAKVSEGAAYDPESWPARRDSNPRPAA